MPRWVQQGRSSRWVESPGDVPQDTEPEPAPTPLPLRNTQWHDAPRNANSVLISTPLSLPRDQWVETLTEARVPTDPEELSDSEEENEAPPPPSLRGQIRSRSYAARRSMTNRYSIPINDIVVIQAPRTEGELPSRRMMRLDPENPHMLLPLRPSPEPAEDPSTEGIEGAEDRVNPEEVDGPRPRPQPRSLTDHPPADLRQLLEMADRLTGRSPFAPTANPPAADGADPPYPIPVRTIMTQRDGEELVAMPIFATPEEARRHHELQQQALKKMEAPTAATELHGLIAEALDKWDQVRNGWAKDYPHEFMCALSLHVMRDPVCCADGYTYERVHIEHHIRIKGTSPRTMLPLSHPHVYPSVTMRQLMEHWVEKALHVHKDKTLEGFLRQRLESIKKAKEQAEASERTETVV